MLYCLIQEYEQGLSFATVVSQELVQQKVAQRLLRQAALQVGLVV